MSISPLVWVALVCLGGIGLYETLTEDPPSNTLEYLHQEKTVVVRLPGRSFDFPILGARVAPSQDWVYLSTTNPALAAQPTFVNVAKQRVFVLRPAIAIQTDLAKETSVPLATAIQKFDGMEIQWFLADSPVRTIDISWSGIRLPLQWTAWSPSRLGMLVSGKLRLILVAYGPEGAVGTGPSVGFDEAIEEFCRGISPLPDE